MGIIGYVFAIFLSTFLGYLLFISLLGKKTKFHLIETIIYSFFIGVFLEGFFGFLLGISGISINLFSFLFINIVSISFFIFYLKKSVFEYEFEKINIKKQFMHLKMYEKLLIILGLLWVSFKLIFGFLGIISLPTYQDDTFQNWNMRAKIFYERESLVLDKNDEDYLGRGYRQYPITPSMYKTYLITFVGEWKEGLVNLPSFIYFFLGIVLMFFVVFRETENFKFASLGVYVISAIPLYFIHGTNPYADVMMSIYFFLAVYFSYLFISGKTDNLLLAILFIGILGYIKTEGLIIFTTSIFLGIIGFVLLNYKDELKNIKKYFVILFGVLVINLPFIFFKFLHNLGFANGDAALGDTSLQAHPEIFYPLYRALFHTGAYNLIFLFVSIILVLWFYKGFYKKGANLFILFSLLVSFLLIIFVYFTTFTFQYVIDQTGINRSMMQITYLLVFVAVLFLYQILNVRKN